MLILEIKTNLNSYLFDVFIFFFYYSIALGILIFKIFFETGLIVSLTALELSVDQASLVFLLLLLLLL